MPSHEAHFIDFQSGLLRTLILAATLRAKPGRPVPPIRIGNGLYSVREAFAQALDGIRDEAAALEAAYGMENVIARASEFGDAYLRAVASYERAERDRKRSAAIDTRKADAFAVAFRTAAGKGDARVLISSEGRMETTTDVPPVRAWLRGRHLVDKVFFIESEDATGAESLGEMYGEGVGRAEQSKLARALSLGRLHTMGRRTITERLLAVAAELQGTDNSRGVVFLVPYSWELTNALDQEGQFVRAPTRQSAIIGELAGHRVYDLGDHESPWAAAVVAGTALSFRQFIPNSGEPLTAVVREIDDELAATLIAEGTTAVAESGESVPEKLKLSVLVEVAEAVEIGVDRGGIRRVGIPAYARLRSRATAAATD
jgi:hypothetical protein